MQAESMKGYPWVIRHLQGTFYFAIHKLERKLSESCEDFKLIDEDASFVKT